jgi:hypothetical protein
VRYYPRVDEKPPRHLTVADSGLAVRRWWKKQRLEEVTDLTTLAQALSDVGILSLGHLAKRLCDPKTPQRVKDQIALTMGPKLAVEIRGRMPPAGDDGATGGLLEAYRVS